jgi:hypothetical protein
MSNIAPVSSTTIPVAPQADASQPSVMSKVAQKVSVAAELERSMGETIEKAMNGRGDAASLVELQMQTAGLNISTSAIAALIATLSTDLKKLANDLR